MKNKSLIFLIFLVFIIVIGAGAVSAQDTADSVIGNASSTDQGTVSGDVDVDSVNPGTTSGELNYEIPSEASDIQSATVYVNIYSGSGKDLTYVLDSNTTVTTVNGNQSLGYEVLQTDQCSPDATVYTLNDHVTRVYSDYQIIYDATDILKGLNGTSISIKVDSIAKEGEGYQFDGRIKLIGLVLAYNDGDDDVIDYWVDANQYYTTTNCTVTMDTSSLQYVDEASWTNIALSSTELGYKINDQPVADPEHNTGNGFYYQYNKWNVTDYILPENQTIFTFSNNGYSAKSVLTVLKVKTHEINSTVDSIAAADNSKNIVYPGFDNTLKVTVTTNYEGKYVVNLLADGTVVNSTEIDLIAGKNNLTLVDPTIRPVNNASKYGNASGTYETVAYQVQILSDDILVADANYTATVLYNGYLGKDAYNETSLEPFYTATITGDVVVLTNGTYAGTTTKYPVTDFAVELPENSTIVKALMYVTYTYGANDNINMFNVTLNGNACVPVYFARDASNLKSNSGYGVVVYDVTDLVAAGVNVLDLNKTGSAGVYPTTLIYMYNTTGSDIVKEVYISNGADLLGTYGGLTNPIKVDYAIDVDATGVKDAVAYIFANGAVDGRGTVVINGESEDHPWNGSSQSTDLYTKNINGTINATNSISVVFSGTSGSFTVLQQMIVLTKDAPVEPVATNISASDVSVVYNNDKNLVVSLVDVNGNPIANANVSIVLNKVENVLPTDVNGQVTLAIPSNLVPNTYVAEISYAGNDTYTNSSATANVVVKKATVKLTAKKKTFKAKVKTKKYKVVLKNNNGVAMKNVKLALKVNGKKYKATTNKKGKATFKITKLTKKGKHKAKIKFAGDAYYNKLTKKVKITIKK